MKAIAVRPGVAGSLEAVDIAEPPGPPDGLLVRTLAVGVCGTDAEIISGWHGAAPGGSEHLIIGHESLGIVEEAPPGSGFRPGDNIAGIVRRPDPVPCACCAQGEWDMCTNGRFTERGIKALHGFAAEMFTIEEEFAVKVDPELGVAGVLMEPASIVAKAWRRIDALAAMSCSPSKRVLVTGAGPIGLLAALFARQRDLEVHVLDQVTEGLKPQLVKELGAEYHSSAVEEALPGAEITIECTGATPLIFPAILNAGSNGIVCLTGVSGVGQKTPVDAGAINRDLVLENGVVFGSVNANRADYGAAAESLARADRSWLEALITREVPLSSWRSAYEPEDGDVKRVLRFSER